MRSPTYFNLLLTAWQQFQADDRRRGVGILEKRCQARLHFASATCIKESGAGENDEIGEEENEMEDSEAPLTRRKI